MPKDSQPPPIGDAIGITEQIGYFPYMNARGTGIVIDRFELHLENPVGDIGLIGKRDRAIGSAAGGEDVDIDKFLLALEIYVKPALVRPGFECLRFVQSYFVNAGRTVEQITKTLQRRTVSFSGID